MLCAAQPLYIDGSQQEDQAVSQVRVCIVEFGKKAVPKAQRSACLPIILSKVTAKLTNYQFSA